MDDVDEGGGVCGGEGSDEGDLKLFRGFVLYRQTEKRQTFANVESFPQLQKWKDTFRTIGRTDNRQMI